MLLLQLLLCPPHAGAGRAPGWPPGLAGRGPGTRRGQRGPAECLLADDGVVHLGAGVGLRLGAGVGLHLGPGPHCWPV